MTPESLFFPYQKRWLADKSKIKIFEKSRRVGGTWVQSFEDVTDCIERPGLKVFFSSADMTAASEYIDYCEDWINKLNAVSKALSEVDCGALEECEFADEDKGVKSKVIEFNNRSKIIVLSSNPKAFRSKGGKIVWDEAAHHDNDRKMWAAAKPAAMWGYPIRILSTHNGVNSLFNVLIEKCRKGELDYSVHRVDIFSAVAEGLADRICGRMLTRKERDAWIENEHKGCLTEAMWQEEYCCNPQDEAKALLSYDIIGSCTRENILGMEQARGRLYLGMDVARRRHLSVIYVLEEVGNELVSRLVHPMLRKKWAEQERTLYALLALPNLVRGCLDRTGIGDQFCERAQEKFGSFKVEGVNFSGSVKENLAINLLHEFEDNTVVIPKSVSFDGKDQQTESLHSVRKIVTAANNVRYDATTDENGHGDFFWGLALAVMAARNGDGGATFIASGDPWKQSGGRDTFPGFSDDGLGGFR